MLMKASTGAAVDVGLAIIAPGVGAEKVGVGGAIAAFVTAGVAMVGSAGVAAKIGVMGAGLGADAGFAGGLGDAVDVA
jgi:hypothetical protein